MKPATFSAVRFFEVRMLVSVDDLGVKGEPQVVDMVYEAFNDFCWLHVIDVNQQELVLGPAKPDSTPRKK